MRWPPWKRSPDKKGRGMRHQGQAEANSTEHQLLAHEANAALGRADAALYDALSATSEVNRVAASLLRTRRRNSFAEMMMESFRGHA